MLQDLSTYKKYFKDYTELRVQENRMVYISCLNGSIIANGRNSKRGVSARVYKKGSWGFASNRTIDEDSARQVIISATGNADFLNAREKRDKGALPVMTASAKVDFSTKKNRRTQRELIEFIEDVDGYITKNYPKLKSRTVSLNCLDMEKSLVTSDGSTAYSMIPRSIMYVVLSIMKDNQPFDLYETYGGLGQFEDVFSTPEMLFEEIDNQYEHLMKKTEGIYAKSGYHDCILDSELGGILAHEAIGHTTEADLVRGGSIASDYMDEQVASPLFSLVDFANTFDDEVTPVPVYVDDEGTKAEDVTIIKNGILKSYMHNKDTANHFGVSPTGNARGYDFYDEPLIRMRNTAIIPGESKLEDMIASIDDGYYLMKPSNGQADSTSEFMFGVVLGYEIKNGKLGKAIRDTTISGVAFDMLKTVSMVSDDMSWSCSGMCGKKQSIPVGMGGPAIKCKINIGGK